jgi:hypothetical protein
LKYFVVAVVVDSKEEEVAAPVVVCRDLAGRVAGYNKAAVGVHHTDVAAGCSNAAAVVAVVAAHHSVAEGCNKVAGVESATSPIPSMAAVEL